MKNAKPIKTKTPTVFFLILPILLLNLIIVRPLYAETGSACTPDSQTITSDNGDIYSSNGSSGNAVNTFDGSPEWIAPPAGAHWIWKTYLVNNPEVADSATFTKTFSVTGANAAAGIDISADDYFKIFLNGNLAISESGEGIFHGIHHYELSSYLEQGENTLTIEVTNAPYFYQGQGTPYNNPAGVAYAFTLTNNCIDETTAPPIQASVGDSNDSSTDIPNTISSGGGQISDSTNSDGSQTIYLTDTRPVLSDNNNSDTNPPPKIAVKISKKIAQKIHSVIPPKIISNIGSIFSTPVASAKTLPGSVLSANVIDAASANKMSWGLIITIAMIVLVISGYSIWLMKKLQ
jgi:hypothetical protein